MTMAAKNMGSMHWTDEEAKLMKAIFSWEDAEAERRRPPKPDTVGELRILVLGAKGTGKTSVLKRFARDGFRTGSSSRGPSADQGCRQAVEIDGKHYMVDVLEMPSKHLASHPLLEQGLNITEGAVLLYDICDPSTLALIEGLEDLIKSGLGPRDYGLLLVGNKSDVDDETRKVSWADGKKAAESFTLKCGFLEVSAKRGDNVADLFAKLGADVLRLKQETQRRKEDADRESILKLNQTMARPVKKKLGLWKTLTTPLFKRW